MIPWFPQSLFRVVGDGFFATLAGTKLLHTTIISRIQRNAEIYDLPVRPKRKGRGRPRKKGKRLLCPEKRARTSRRFEFVSVLDGLAVVLVAKKQPKNLYRSAVESAEVHAELCRRDSLPAS